MGWFGDDEDIKAAGRSWGDKLQGILPSPAPEPISAIASTPDAATQLIPDAASQVARNVTYQAAGGSPGIQASPAQVGAQAAQAAGGGPMAQDVAGIAAVGIPLAMNIMARNPEAAMAAAPKRGVGKGVRILEDSEQKLGKVFVEDIRNDVDLDSATRRNMATAINKLGPAEASRLAAGLKSSKRDRIIQALEENFSDRIKRQKP